MWRLSKLWWVALLLVAVALGLLHRRLVVPNGIPGT